MSRAGAEKPRDQLAFKRGGRGTVVKLPPLKADPPAAPEFVGEYAATVWQKFWTTPVSGLVDVARDGERLRHWIWCVHSREAIEHTLEQNPMAIGSMEQMVAHPLWMVWAKLSREIEAAETHFGMTPLAKMRLTGALDQAEAAEESIKARREGRRPQLMPAKKE